MRPFVIIVLMARCVGAATTVPLSPSSSLSPVISSSPVTYTTAITTPWITATSFTTTTFLITPGNNASTTLPLPSSLVTTTPSSALAFSSSPPPPTAAAATTTTTLDPIESLKCNGQFPQPGGNASYRLVVAELVEYRCDPGYKETGNGANLVECKRGGWEPAASPLQCVAIDVQPVIQRVPPEVFQSLITVGALLSAVIVCLILFGVCLHRFKGMPISRTLTWKQTTNPPTSVKGGNSRRWPWKRPPRLRYPPGHLGPDGVAWIVNRDNMAFPLKH